MILHLHLHLQDQGCKSSGRAGLSGPAKFVKPVIYNPVQDLPHHLPILETVTLQEELLEEKKPTRMNFRR